MSQRESAADNPPGSVAHASKLSGVKRRWSSKSERLNRRPKGRSSRCPKVFVGHVPTPFVFEGYALRPEYIAPLISGKLLVVFLYADNDFLQERMRSEAKYDQADEAKRSIIDKFIDRSLRDNSEMHVAARNHDVRVVDTPDGVAVATLFDELVQRTLVLPSRKH